MFEIFSMCSRVSRHSLTVYICFGSKLLCPNCFVLVKCPAPHPVPSPCKISVLLPFENTDIVVKGITMQKYLSHVRFSKWHGFHCQFSSRFKFLTQRSSLYNPMFFDYDKISVFEISPLPIFARVAVFLGPPLHKNLSLRKSIQYTWFQEQVDTRFSKSSSN